MKDSKLVRYLQTLTKKEVKSLTTFIKKETTNTTLISLYERIIPYHPDYEALEETKLLKEVMDMNGKPLSIKQLQTNLSKLCPLVEQFFVEQDLLVQHDLQGYFLTLALAKRGLYHDFQKKGQIVITDVESKSNLDTDDFQLLFNMYQMLYFHPDTEKYKSRIEALEKGIKYVEVFYILTQMRYICDIMIRKNLLSDQIYINTDLILELSQKYEYSILKLYAQLIALMQHHQDNLFFKIVNDLKRNIHNLFFLDKSILLHK